MGFLLFKNTKTGIARVKKQGLYHMKKQAHCHIAPYPVLFFTLVVHLFDV